ncbi:MAG: hypothetical protein K940chlam5_00490 [Candidatus Anoxychlamydiales bacterium]|nr:hypothetical protein [Candidatus Anoxychlamydiales bacterium]
MTARLQAIRTGVSTKISSVTTSISSGATNVSNKVRSGAQGVLNSLSSAKSYVVSSLTISKENREKINAIPKKIWDFIIKNRSLIFFGLTVLFSYYLAPIEAFEYLTIAGFSLTGSFVSGMTLGTGLLALKNILFSYPVRNAKENKGKINQDDKINYLLGIANLCQAYINPARSLGTIIGSAGFMVVKTAYKLFLPADELKKDPVITILLPKELFENANIDGLVTAAQTQTG